MHLAKATYKAKSIPETRVIILYKYQIFTQLTRIQKQYQHLGTQVY